MPKDYISREDAISCVKHAWAKGLEPTQYLEELDAVDVVEHKRGAWITAWVNGVEFQRCTECGAYLQGIFFANDYAVNFCPNCGADMREKGNG